MKTDIKGKIYSIRYMNSMRLCRAQSAEQARRIFARSINSEVADGRRHVRISIEQVRVYAGSLSDIAQSGYDAACRADLEHVTASRELRAMHKQSYFNWALNPNEVKRDKVMGKLARLFA
jgi:hypothetical protein